MAVTYYRLGGNKKLNEIVMAGSHDAGITEGRQFEKTQALNIYGQAGSGVRLFDLRIAGEAVKSAQGQKGVELKTYHGKAKSEAVRGQVKGLQHNRIVDAGTLSYGTWGEGLVQILQGAKNFVQANNQEFLLLKFDKCKNWNVIAELCISELGAALYTGAGNLNQKTLDDLKGKVVVLFTPNGYQSINPNQQGVGGILQIKNLYPNGTYDPNLNGLQYWGKGGTSIMTVGTGRSIKENIKKQAKIMTAAGGGDPNVMGMMYWTTTGLFGNIQKRNENMWEAKYTNKMRGLWGEIRGDVSQRTPVNNNPAVPGHAAIANRFLPNFIMIDFADENKCRTIYELNGLTPTGLMELDQLTQNLF